MRSQEFIKSYVRLKPVLPGEAPAVTYSKREVIVNKTKEIFSFNEVFGDAADNEYVYRTAVQPIISDVLNGYSACVLAYGQTFSGKTYLMRGGKNSMGLIPLCINEIFGRIQELRLTAKVSISYFEIYNENIIDLLGSIEENSYLQLRQDNKKNLVIVNLIEQTVTDEFNALQHYQRGELMRKSANNTINFSSSRSHTIFKVTLSMVEEGGRLVEGSIYMVDLAGSESIGKTNAVGQLKKEAENINKSLLALTSVIRSISQKDLHITYRNSKLTRILQPSLSGNSKTIVICTAKQTEDCLSETINTLRFGVSASSIRTEARQHVVEADYDRSSMEILQSERAERAKLQMELMTRTEVIENLKLDNVRLRDELDDCKHKLFSLENDNRNKGGLIEYYQSLQEKQSNSRNLFMKSSEETLERLEKENRMLKASNNTLRQALETKEKQIGNLQKNERTLLDKVHKYETELANLQKVMSQARHQQKKKVEVINNPASQAAHIANNKMKIENDFQWRNNKRKEQISPQTHISSPFTIGKVVDLCTSLLAMRRDMNHYLTTIKQMHDQICDLQRQLDESRQQLQNSENREEVTGRRDSIGSAKVKDKAREREKNEMKRLQWQNQNLKRRNNKYIRLVQKTAESSDKSIIGYSEYLQKNFKYSQDELFVQLFQDDPDDYRPIKRHFPLPKKKPMNQPKNEPDTEPPAQ